MPDSAAVNVPAPAVSAPARTLPIVHQPTDSFHCVHFNCTLMARACLLRQQKRYLQHIGGSTAVRHEQRIALEFQNCASGQCAQGNAVREQLGDQEVEPARAQPSGLSGRTAAARARKNAKRPKPAGLPPAELDALDEDLARRARAQEQEKASAEIAAAVESMRAAAAPEPPRPAVRPPPQGVDAGDGARTSRRPWATSPARPRLSSCASSPTRSKGGSAEQSIAR